MTAPTSHNSVSAMSSSQLIIAILASADENMDIYENGVLVGHLEGTREEWIMRINALILEESTYVAQ